MYNSYFFHRYILLTENSFNQTKLMEAEVVRATDNTTKPQSEFIPYVPMLFAPILFMTVWAIAAFMVPSDVRKFPQNDKVTSNRFKQVPCKNCQFFQDNHYLNCAVHPSIVLTKQALNCSDYFPPIWLLAP